MAWGSKTQIATNLSIVGTEQFSSAVSLNPGESAQVQVISNSGGTTDSLIVSVYGTLDASTETWDEVPITQFLLDCTSGNDTEVSFIVSRLYRFRIGFVRSGSTDTLVTNAYYRSDGISV